MHWKKNALDFMWWGLMIILKIQTENNCSTGKMHLTKIKNYISGISLKHLMKEDNDYTKCWRKITVLVRDTKYI